MRIEHWVLARREGQAVARTIVGERTPFTDVPFFWSQHYDICINYVGHAECWETTEIDGSLEQHDGSVRYRAGGPGPSGGEHLSRPGEPRGGGGDGTRDCPAPVTDQGVVVLGIPIPSSSPLFLSIVAVHVAGGLVCAGAGIVAMMAPKRRGRHPRAGAVYYWSLVVVFLTMAALSILRWPHNTHLFVLGIFSFAAGTVGRVAVRWRLRGWLPVHVTAMGGSYILLLTAFYVDNGPHLPLWRSLPTLAHWFLPSLVGVPILAWVLRRHPLIVRSRVEKSPP